MKIITIALLVLRCSNIERSRVFYENLGLDLKVEKHGSGPEHYSTRIGSLVLELYPRTEADTGGIRIGFMVTNLSMMLQTIQRNGINPIRVALEASPPHALIRDPDGHSIELTQAAEPLDDVMSD